MVGAGEEEVVSGPTLSGRPGYDTHGDLIILIIESGCEAERLT
jgi:hypothetical protein